MNPPNFFGRLPHIFLTQPLLALLLVPAIPLHGLVEAPLAQDRPAGLWQGAVELPSTNLQLSLKLWQEEGIWAGTISIPVQNLTDFPLDEVRLDDRSIRFAMKGIPGNPVFEGNLSEDDSTIKGNLSQGGMTFPFQMEWKGEAEPVDRPDSADADSAQPFLGSWEGDLLSQGRTLLLRFHLKKGPQGKVEATLDSPDQGQNGLPVSRVEVQGSTLTLHLPYLQASFQGDLTEDGQQITGAWRQGGNELPLTVKKAE